MFEVLFVENEIFLSGEGRNLCKTSEFHPGEFELMN